MLLRRKSVDTLAEIVQSNGGSPTEESSAEVEEPADDEGTDDEGKD
jgi:hypothetical protein